MNYKTVIKKINKAVEQKYLVYKRSIHMVGIEYVIKDISLENISDKYFRLNGKDISLSDYFKLRDYLELLWQCHGKKWQERTFY